MEAARATPGKGDRVMNPNTPLFLEVDFSQCRKQGQDICGDTFKSQKLDGGARILAVLSDGLGSGVKAGILSGMTAAMALKFTASNMDFAHSAEIMMDALPVCQVRKISYATFTIVDCAIQGRARIIEMDNPATLFLRRNQPLPLEYRKIAAPKGQDRELRIAETDTRPQDRVVLVSDGITQAGIGTKAWPLGWRETGLNEFVLEQLDADPELSAHALAENIIHEALKKEPRRTAQDDMTCGVIYFREPRRLLLLTGPPYDKDRDTEYARKVDEFDGRKVICGGTTATIVGRELHRDIHMDLKNAPDDMPPPSYMEGVDLVTEGILTLTRAAQVLEEDKNLPERDPAARLAALLLESDVIEFVVGSRINEAHQDPKLPIDLEIRRNIVRRLAGILEKRYLKETSIACI